MARGLSEAEVDGLRGQLADGKRPRVQLSGPHFPVGATGTVVRIGQPDTDGPDFLRVRVKVDNMTDELAFGPGELTIPGRSRGRGKAGSPRTGAAGAGAARPGAAKAGPATAGAARPSPAEPRAANASAAKPRAAKAGAAKPSAAGAGAATVAAAATSRRRKTAPAQPVSFTVTSAGSAWSLTASKGSRQLVKNAELPPGVVGALADLLGQPALSEAIEQINAVTLADAQARAERLRAELSELEAVLATHSRP
ncbi:MAG TPA: hypothetical protein VHO01_10480 [Jatrophihabitans sp.]|nr:hypothetical protein [Jatrophihabitans sp.]